LAVAAPLWSLKQPPAGSDEMAGSSWERLMVLFRCAVVPKALVAFPESALRKGRKRGHHRERSEELRNGGRIRVAGTGTKDETRPFSGMCRRSTLRLRQLRPRARRRSRLRSRVALLLQHDHPSISRISCDDAWRK
jgi:hypothetical protein